MLHLTRRQFAASQSALRSRSVRPSSPRRLQVEGLEDRCVPATPPFIVTSTADGGPGTLRQAILDANATAGADAIEFAIGSGFQGIAPLSALPSITDPVAIDATTQPGWGGTPIIELRGDSAGADANGFTVTAADSTIRGFVINRFSGSGVLVTGTSAVGNTIAGNYIGISSSGSVAFGNKYGVQTAGGSSNTTVGTNGDGVNDLGERNVISGNTSLGVRIDGEGTVNTVVAGNYIGPNAGGAFAVGNGFHGVQIANGAKAIRIGTNGDGVGDTDERNVISGNVGQGVLISGVEQVVVAGNYIGTDAGGTTRIPNGFSGVRIGSGGHNNLVGTNGDGVGDAAERNVISGNTQWGIFISDVGSDSNVVAGNYIGTSATGHTGIPNVFLWDGVWITAGAKNNLIGTDGSNDAFNENERNVISGNRRSGVLIDGSGTDGNVVAGNYIGTNVEGTGPLANGVNGIHLDGGATNTRIGTNADGIADVAERNVISANPSRGIRITGAGTNNHVIAGNYIGTNAAGMGPLGNGVFGVDIAGGAANNTVGGLTATPGTGAGNVVSANGWNGIGVFSSSNNLVAGNIVGLNAAGTSSLGNGGSFPGGAAGVGFAFGGTNNTLGGTAAGARNIISGNAGGGAAIVSGASNVVVQGNYIGTDITGTAALANGRGVSIEGGASNNTIGGSSTAARNLISGNGTDGVRLVGTNTSNNVIVANYIGTNAAGTAALSNGGIGVLIAAGARNTGIGTDGNGAGDAAEANLISGNGRDGVQIYGTGSDNNVMAGNLIGTNAAGDAAIPNGAAGVAVFGGAKNNRVGTSSSDAALNGSERNIISGNVLLGVFLGDPGTSGNEFAGNFIGTNAAGTAALSNGQYGGVYIGFGATGNSIGGPVPGAGNVISGNVGNGVTVTDAGSVGNRIRGNAIYGNGGLGIDLGADGVTANDAGDSDTGPNQQVNFPELATVLLGASTHITGTLDSPGNGPVTIDFFAGSAADPAGYGEGQRYLGSASLTGDGNFDVTLTALVHPGEWITATATDAAGNTSEFSLAVPGGRLVIYGTDGADDIKVNPGGGAPEIKVKVNGSQQTFFGVTEIVIHAKGGNDYVQIVGGITLPVTVFGGAGDDQIKAGGGPSVLIGGDGNDTLLGGAGRDVLIGGAGADLIGGSGADDVLVAGSTAFDTDLAALGLIRSEWTSARSFADRVANLAGTAAGGSASANGSVVLTTAGPDRTVFDDDAVDALAGDGGADWFVLNSVGGVYVDQVSDMTAFEGLFDTDM